MIGVGEAFASPPSGRVGDWRAGLGRSLCSLLARSFVCECHTISAVPRFQPPPRRTQHADFPHCALLFASPQGLWDLSAFALTYILRRRSCKSMDAFVISSLPSLWSETLQTAGLLRSTGVTPPQRYSNPSVTLSPSIDFPVEPVIRSTCSDDFSSGRGGLLQLLGMSLSPCCRFHPAEVLEPHRSDFGSPCRLRPPVGGSAFGATHFRGHFCVHCCYGPVTRRLPTGDVVDRLQKFRFPATLLSKLRGL